MESNTTPENMTGNEQPNAPQEAGKTFTQDELNQILSKRLAAEKAKSGEDLAVREQELTRRETLLTAREKLSDAGYSSALADVLNINSPEDIDTCINALNNEKAMKKESTAPTPGFKIGGPGPSGNTKGNYRDPLRDAMGLK